MTKTQTPAEDDKSKSAAESAPEPISEAVADFLSEAIGFDLPAKAEGGEGEEGGDPAKPEPVKPAKPAKPETPKPETPKPVRAKVATQEDLARAAGEGAARAILESQKPKPEPEKPGKDEPPADEELFGDIEARNIKALRHMEQRFGDKYAGIADKYRNGLTQVLDYKSKWEKDNPGKQFDENDGEHSAFLDSIQVDWEDDDFTMAVSEQSAAEAAEKAAAKVREEVSEKLEEYERKERLNQSFPEILKQESSAAAKLYQKLADHDDLGVLADAVKDDGTIDVDRLKEIESESPLVADMIVSYYAGQLVQPLASDAYKLMNGLERFDPKNKGHQFLSDFLMAKEKEVLGDSAQQIDGEGRMFAPRSKFFRMKESEQAKHWTLTPEHAAEYLVEAYADDAIKAYEREKGRLARYGLTAARPAGERKAPIPQRTTRESSQQADEVDDGLQPVSNGKPDSPSFVSEPKTARSRGGNRAGGDSEVIDWLRNY
jgi:hypothetical protein